MMISLHILIGGVKDIALRTTVLVNNGLGKVGEQKFPGTKSPRNERKERSRE